MPCNNPHRVHLVKDMAHRDSFDINQNTGEITNLYPEKYLQGLNKIDEISTYHDETSKKKAPAANQINFTKYKKYAEHQLPKNVTEINLPCGKCLACLHSRAKDWALRIMHETSALANDKKNPKPSCFVTLTFTDENRANKSKPHSVDLHEIQKFIKRMRSLTKAEFKVYYCGEYGDRSGHAHYHLAIMGYDFPDKLIHKQNDDGTKPEYRSYTLEKLWPYGHSHILNLDYGLAYYLASYLVKKAQRAIKKHDHKTIEQMESNLGLVLSSKLIKKLANSVKTMPAKIIDPHYPLEVDSKIFNIDIEFAHMSRKPGIGKTWYKKYKKDLLKGFITSNGTIRAIPRYYMKLLKEDFPEEFANMTKDRLKQIFHIKYETIEATQERLDVKEKLLQIKQDAKDRNSF